MVTQAPSLMKAAYNLLLLDPKKKMPVAGMNLLFNRIADMFPDAPFFYLSTSPWNVESSIRHFIANHGFPEGPLLLRDLDPRPKTFIPSGVQHKLEYAEQLMADFPDMKFILIGDDGQKDPTPIPRACAGDRHPAVVSTRSRRQSRHRCGACGHAADPGHRCPGIHGNDRLESDENHAAVPETTDGRLTFSYARSRGYVPRGIGNAMPV